MGKMTIKTVEVRGEIHKWKCVVAKYPDAINAVCTCSPVPVEREEAQ